jgi:transcriptional repressor NrdR
MKCPFCRHEETDVTNSRSTYRQTQIWRRRSCQYCHSTFTTYEKPDLGFIKVEKKSGRRERYSRAKLFAGIYGAYLSIPSKETTVDEVTDEVEANLLDTRQKDLTSQEIAEIVLPVLKKRNMAAFLRFLAYQTDLESEAQLNKELKKYR